MLTTLLVLEITTLVWLLCLKHIMKMIFLNRNKGRHFNQNNLLIEHHPYF